MACISLLNHFRRHILTHGLKHTTHRTALRNIFPVRLYILPRISNIFPVQQQFTSAKFHLVDLAGSERNKKTGTVGERFREAVNINGGCAVLCGACGRFVDFRSQPSVA